MNVAIVARWNHQSTPAVRHKRRQVRTIELKPRGSESGFHL